MSAGNVSRRPSISQSGSDREKMINAASVHGQSQHTGSARSKLSIKTQTAGTTSQTLCSQCLQQQPSIHITVSTILIAKRRIMGVKAAINATR
mmetsp:Transcript_114726/g.161094  ORF Transcript_114726/g.161094 Transcript_114726/m.161094 type:complete len:93 (+) Transcript_114726:237-515(+)